MDKLSVEMLTAALAACHDGVLLARYQDGEPCVVFANTAFAQQSGFTLDELLGQRCPTLEHHPDDQAIAEEMHRALRNAQPFDNRLRQYSRNGQLFYSHTQLTFIERDRNAYALLVVRDITQEEYVKNVLDKVNVLFREMSKRLEYTSETDSLTQLKNRGHLSTRGEFMLGAAKRERLRLHAIVVDVDSFKLLNTSGGSSLGDECLVRVADVIKGYFCRATDIAIRLCDDEFVIICIEDDDQRVFERADRMREEVCATQVKDYEGRLHDISVSVGICSLTPSKNTTLEEMMQNAGQLLFQGRQGLINQVLHDRGQSLPSAVSVQH